MSHQSQGQKPRQFEALSVEDQETVDKNIKDDIGRLKADSHPLSPDILGQVIYTVVSWFQGTSIANTIKTAGRPEIKQLTSKLSQDRINAYSELFRAATDENGPETWAYFIDQPELRKVPDHGQAVLARDRVFETSIDDPRIQIKATEASWNSEFQGDAHKALWTYLNTSYNPTKSKVSTEVFTPYSAIIQSTGVGKSRLIDKVSESHFVIPLNLSANGTGYPPGDEVVLFFLSSGKTQKDTFRRCCAFLRALFDHAIAIIQGDYFKEAREAGLSALASMFRLTMSDGMTFARHGEFRRAFYSKVLTLAEQYSTEGKQPAGADAKGRLSQKKRSKATEYEQNRVAELQNPLVTLAFEESHTLTDQMGDGERLGSGNLNVDEHAFARTWSIFGELRRALRGLNGLSIFALFTSTTGKIANLVPSRMKDPSARVMEGKYHAVLPFTGVGLDQLATNHKLSLKKGFALSYVASGQWMAYLGRPLFGSLYENYAAHASTEDSMRRTLHFAQQKLLCANDVDGMEPLTLAQQLACLSQRLALELNCTTYTAQCKEREQVEGHLRLCLKVDPTFETMVTLSASEPILAEAAYVIMQQSRFNVPKALRSVLDGFAVDKGERGELLATLLLTLARDEAVKSQLPWWVSSSAGTNSDDVPGPVMTTNAFFSGLLELFKADPSEIEAEDQKTIDAFAQDFDDCFMHFNHFIKAQQLDVFQVDHLLGLLARGAALLCANTFGGVDAALTFVSGAHASEDTLYPILVQVKNDKKYSDNVKNALFAPMDPYRTGFWNFTHQPQKPIIRIVFALAVPDIKSKVRITKTEKIVSKFEDGKHAGKTKTFDAYDIWIAGLSPRVLGPITPQTQDVWKSLLDASYGWDKLYASVSDAEADQMRSMTPGAGTGLRHWNGFIEDYDASRAA
ncbi:uncharacterized protein B0H18DRAFT_937176 [Fomitopsis serialis]|uniref:uncharacterized protein n=1 Tax=Fomitopsis serialis TaxID=139415 RepID=UPI002007E546|nr:uncharacterized protein B0H18DRAFT_937176 [Neoantrodia serialis]KAH9919507.1 hypothetical protein B0H18DRAFT_937176 [Neoantrodia serialis]